MNEYTNELVEVAEDQKFLGKLAIAVLVIGLLSITAYMMLHTVNADVCAQIVGNCTVIR